MDVRSLLVVVSVITMVNANIDIGSSDVYTGCFNDVYGKF